LKLDGFKRIGGQFFSLANQVKKCLMIQNKDFVSEGPQPCKFAGIDGVSEFLGHASSLLPFSI
jgi:hypothetical protein